MFIILFVLAKNSDKINNVRLYVKITRPQGSQIVIEEIDNAVHPSRAALLVKILK
ncbi:hypothetical protein H6F32_06010 [Anabaena sp. FACHB-1237]|uniref:hypothetical protein n=1 Tax=Anabaena sp. FACHB-1237 TaxID=2692769 RepID=UPI0016801DFE|nr:hypothetical protein [Anabaena sp. FACHB-1237]MBD2137147.1 hypothetical protein [Anabaena sp. FACHB-1237]